MQLLLKQCVSLLIKALPFITDSPSVFANFPDQKEP